MKCFDWYLEDLVDEDTPYLRGYLLERMTGEGPLLPAVLICPGGGYSYLSPREAEPIAMAFAAKGYQTFVLYYSVLPQRFPQPLLDAAKAMAALRAHSEEWAVDPDRVAVCGFSAGGHLAAALSVLAGGPEIAQLGLTDKQVRPNAAILCYAVLSVPPDEASAHFAHDVLGAGEDGLTRRWAYLDESVDGQTPPMFLWQTAADTLVRPGHCLAMANALSRQNVPFELHIFPEGGHGLALANARTSDGRPELEQPAAARWVELCADWLKRTM